MLLSILILTLARVTPHPRGITTSLLPQVYSSMPRCLKRKNGGQLSAPAKVNLMAVGSCVDDIEEVPSGLLQGYQQHQAAGYHDFTATEVSPSDAAQRASAEQAVS